MKDIIQVLKIYRKLDSSKEKNEYIVILAQYRYKPRFYIQNKSNEDEEYFDIVRKPALIDVYNDFYFYDEKMLPIIFKQNKEECIMDDQDDIVDNGHLPTNDDNSNNTNNEDSTETSNNNSNNTDNEENIIIGRYGYICGGIDDIEGIAINIIQQIEFPFDNGIANVVGNLSTEENSSPAANNSSIYGYVCGGYASDWLSTIDRFQFPFDNGNAIQVGNLSTPKYDHASNNSSIYGYVYGGYWFDKQTFKPFYLSNIDRFEFPFDSGNAIVINNLNKAKFGSWTANNSTIHGYICGNGFSTIERIQFAFDTIPTIIVGNIDGKQIDYFASNNSSTYGYIYGGYTEMSNFDEYMVSSINRFQFPFDSGFATQINNLSYPIGEHSANNSSTHGYIYGGAISTPDFYIVISTISRIEFSFDSSPAIIAGNLTSNINYSAANDETHISGVIY